MDVVRYQEARLQRLSEEPKFRTICYRCMHPDFNCYCSLIEPFDSKIKFVILMHKIEARRRVATGRLSHLCLEDSLLVTGHDFTEDKQVNSLINNPAHHCVVLYPGRNSQNLSELSKESRASFFPAEKKLVVFVIDGTWNTARQMIRSQCFQSLPRVCFTPPGVSSFRVRKQPMPECYSTLEAIHHTIELVADGRGFDLSRRPHDALLRVFDAMVERQIEYARKSHTINTHSRHKRAEAVLV
jgi:DTW domain-containing protein YfiP